jgi:predicted MFS family arabinose efflux permease
MSISRTIKWTIWIIASIFYAYQYVLRVMPSIMLNDIMTQFNLDEAAFGQFSGWYYIGYSLMHLPIGIMLDRNGPRKVMTVCVLLTVVGLLPIVFAEHWIYPIVGRVLIGIGSSAAILGTFKIIRMVFKEAYFTRMLGFSVTIGLLGAIYGGAPLSYLTQTFGYQAVVQGLAFVGVGLALLTYVIVPEMASQHTTSVMTDIKTVFGNRRVVWMCVLAGLMVGPLEGFADVWGVAFLKTAYGFDAALASSIPSMIFVGMCFGSPVLSFVGEKLGHIKTIIISGVMMMVVFVGLVSNMMSVPIMSLSLVIVGVCSAYQILAIYAASTFVDEGVAGLTTAVANMIIMLFGYAFHSVIGGVIKVLGGTTSAEAFTYGISVIPVALTLSVFGFAVIRFQNNLPTAKLKSA